MATALRVGRRSSALASSEAYFLSPFSQTLRYKSTADGVAVKTKPSHHNDHKNNHVYMTPTDFIGSWNPAKDPKEAERNLAMLRREYGKQVKELRKQYIYEMELQRQEQLRKDEARREEIRLRREERKKLKAAAAEVRAAERKASEEEFRRTLLKERQDKLEYWTKRQRDIEAKKAEKKELLRRQSSMWVDENKLEARILEAVVNAQVNPF